MSRVLISIFGLFTMVNTVNGQQNLNHDPQNIVDPTGFMRVLTLPVEVEGSANMFGEWQTGDIYLSQGKFASETTFNYDVVNHMISVLVDEKEYSLNPLAVDSIRIRNSKQTLINPVAFEPLNTDLLLLKLYDSPHLSLYRKTLVEIIKPNYNELLDVGNRNFQIDQDYKYLLMHKAQDYFIELLGKKKELKQWENGNDILKFVKEQNLDLKSEPDLIEVVKYYEQLKY